MSPRDPRQDADAVRPGWGEHDPVARGLRAALAREADTVRPSADGLARITGALHGTRGQDVDGPGTNLDGRSTHVDGRSTQGHIEVLDGGSGDHAGADGHGGDPHGGRRRGAGWTPWVAGLAAAAVAGVVAGASVLGTQDDPTVPVASPSQTLPSPSAPPPTEPGPTEPAASGPPASDPVAPSDPASPTTTAPPPSGSLDQVPVYWVGSTAAGTWLYREFRTVPDAGGEVASAVRAAMSMTPLDPDYTTPWRQPTRLDVTQDADGITIDVSADALAGTSVGSELAERAVQQLVWTATAALGSSVPVTLLVDGAAADAWGTVALGEPMSRDSGARAPLWLDSPAEMAVVPAGDVTVTGQADVFEGNVVWEVRDGGGAVVASGFATAAQGEFLPYEFTVPLTPGEYSVSVYSPDESGGEAPEGPRMFEQDRTIVVR